MEQNFALLGVAGYIAPRHLLAIKETGNNLIAACDPSDSVGILDRYFKGVCYFKDFERFDRHIERLRYQDSLEKIDYVSICSPNHLHNAHIRFGLRVGANVICEKPLVINPWNIDALAELEEKFSGRVSTILQLRAHPAIIQLKESVDNNKSRDIYDINLTYLTSRGPWYHYSWKGDIDKSGGLATNIGVHFFDMLTWIFGDVVKNEVHISRDDIVSGYLELERARVKWILSINRKYLPEGAEARGETTFRSITVDGDEVEFSGGFTDLHTEVYKDILAGNGYGIMESKRAISIVHDIRSMTPQGLQKTSHHLLGGI